MDFKRHRSYSSSSSPSPKRRRSSSSKSEAKKSSKKKKRDRSISDSKHHSKHSKKRHRDSSSDSSVDRSKKRKEKKKKRKKDKKKKKKKTSDHEKKKTEDKHPVPLSDEKEKSSLLDNVGPVPLQKSMKPMTKEEWEKQQSVVRRVYDPTTGRDRLVKGDGEILEEIVSKERQKEINKQATRGDGVFYQSQVGLLK